MDDSKEQEDRMSSDEYWWFSHTDYPEEINDFLTTLIELGMIEEAAPGIARFVIDERVESLTAKQAFVFDRDVIQPHAIQLCPRCGNEIRWSEMLHQDGWCAYCNNLLHKDD